MLPVSFVSFQRYFRFLKFLTLCMSSYHTRDRYCKFVLIICSFRCCRTFLECLENKRINSEELRYLSKEVLSQVERKNV